MANWDERDGESRPTPERIRRGAYVLVDAEDAGVRYAQDLAADPVAAAEMQGLLEPHHVDAFRQFEALARRMMGSPGQRSCLDFTPVGHDDSDGDPEAEREWKDVRAYLGGQYLSVAIAMAYEQVPAQRTLVRETGNKLATFFGTGQKKR